MRRSFGIWIIFLLRIIVRICFWSRNLVFNGKIEFDAPALALESKTFKIQFSYSDMSQYWLHPFLAKRNLNFIFSKFSSRSYSIISSCMHHTYRHHRFKTTLGLVLNFFSYCLWTASYLLKSIWQRCSIKMDDTQHTIPM